MSSSGRLRRPAPTAWLPLQVAFGTLVQLVLEGRPEAELQAVLGFCIRVGLPVTLGQVGGLPEPGGWPLTSRGVLATAEQVGALLQWGTAPCGYPAAADWGGCC